MRYRSLGSSGLTVSALGLGCNNLGGRVDIEASCRIVSAALDHGITFFDVADVYGRRDAHAGASEEALGKALRGRRNDAIVATKFGMKMCAGEDTVGRASGASRSYILRAVEDSLRRLKTEWIDLYQLHCPDPRTPLEETLDTLDMLVRQGKIRYAGVSNLPAWQVVDACHIAQRDRLTGIISCQDEFSLLSRSAEKDLIPAMTRFGLGLLPYFPLASGMLTGKYRRNTPPPQGSRLAVWTYLQARYEAQEIWTLLERLEHLAASHDLSLTDLAFRWLLHHPIVGSVIAGATSESQVIANVSACSDMLPHALWNELNALLAQQGPAE